jgi:hypothetical protein
MEQAMKLFAISAPTPEELKASFQDRRANIVRVTYNTGVALILGTVGVSAISDTLWSLIPAAIGGLLFIVGLCAAYEFSRGPGWASASLTLPENSLNFKAGGIVVLVLLGVMIFFGDKLGLSVKQWGLLGVCSWSLAYYISGMCALFWPRRNGDAGAALLEAE